MSWKSNYQFTNIFCTLKENKIATDFTWKTNLLTDSHSLTGKANHLTNKLSRHSIKLTFSSKYCKLSDVEDESATKFFGDKISNALEALGRGHQQWPFLKTRKKTAHVLQSAGTGICQTVQVYPEQTTIQGKNKIVYTK